jgi:hypothetical protein
MAAKVLRRPVEIPMSKTEELRAGAPSSEGVISWRVRRRIAAYEFTRRCLTSAARKAGRAVRSHQRLGEGLASGEQLLGILKNALHQNFEMQVRPR